MSGLDQKNCVGGPPAAWCTTVRAKGRFKIATSAPPMGHFQLIFFKKNYTHIIGTMTVYS